MIIKLKPYDVIFLDTGLYKKRVFVKADSSILVDEVN